jgi:hypothetical protein
MIRPSRKKRRKNTRGSLKSARSVKAQILKYQRITPMTRSQWLAD